MTRTRRSAHAQVRERRARRDDRRVRSQDLLLGMQHLLLHCMHRGSTAMATFEAKYAFGGPSFIPPRWLLILPLSMQFLGGGWHVVCAVPGSAAAGGVCMLTIPVMFDMCAYLSCAVGRGRLARVGATGGESTVSRHSDGLEHREPLLSGVQTSPFEFCKQMIRPARMRVHRRLRSGVLVWCGAEQPASDARGAEYRRFTMRRQAER
jgi:hypothetical protein